MGGPGRASCILAHESVDKGVAGGGGGRAGGRRKLGWDEPVSKYLPPSLPFSGITIRQLLSHTSGLADSLAQIDSERSFIPHTPDPLLEAIHPPIDPPGSGFLYADEGMFLSQYATERAVGEPWWTFMRRELFEPAGMKSVVSMNPRALIPGRVSPYELNPEGQLIRDTRLEFDFGPLYTDLGMTIADFARWTMVLDGKGPLTPQIVAAMTTPSRLADGKPFSG